MSNATKESIQALFVDDIEARKNAIAAYIKDQSVPFEDRKEIWLTTPDHLQVVDTTYPLLPEFEAKYGEISWYDEFYLDRGSSINLPDKCGGGRFPQVYHFFATKETKDSMLPIVDTEKLDLFILTCMNHGVHAFIFDW